MPGEAAHRIVPSPGLPEEGQNTGIPGPEMTRHASSSSASTPSDCASTPSPSTPSQLSPEYTSPFGPRLPMAKHNTSARPQPEGASSDGGSDSRLGGTGRLAGKFGRGSCKRGPIKMERIKVLTGSEVESDYKEPETMDTRVVMGQEALLRNMETQEGPLLGKKTEQEAPSQEAKNLVPSTVPGEGEMGDPEKEKLDTGQEGPSTLHKECLTTESELDKDSVHLLTYPVLEPKAVLDVGPTESCSPLGEEAGEELSQGQVPSLSFSEPSCMVDPQRVGIPLGLDPDLYYTAPSTPIKIAYCSHLKHQWYPSSPSPGPGSPTDESSDLPESEGLCSPPTSPSGSYITAEGGSWTSSYTSSTSPSCSPNLIAEAELQEAPACYVESLSEIGDELSEDKGSAEKDPCLYKAERPGLSEIDVAFVEDEDTPKGGTCQPHWGTQETSPQRSSSGRSTSSQEGGGESEGSLEPPEEQEASELVGYMDPEQDLELDLNTCISENLATLDAPISPEEVISPDLVASYPFGHHLTAAADTGSLTPATCSSEVSDTDNNSLYGEMASALLYPSQEDSQGCDMMIPASMLPFHGSLIFQADSMEITLFPTEDDPSNDVDAYAAGEDEGDVDEDEDEEEEVEKVVKEEGVEEEGKVLEDLNEEDTSASFLNSLSETSINEGVDESFAFQDDTEESIDSASYNGEEDERLYSTERHAELAQQFPGPDDPAESVAPQQQDSSNSGSGSESEMEISSESSEANHGQNESPVIGCASSGGVIPLTHPGSQNNEVETLVVAEEVQTSQQVELEGIEKYIEPKVSTPQLTADVPSMQASQTGVLQPVIQARADDSSFTREPAQTSTDSVAQLSASLTGAAAETVGKHLDLVAELADQKNGNNVDSADPTLGLHETATNDLNKGVPLLSHLKDDCYSPSNIPVSPSPEASSEIPDNLAVSATDAPTLGSSLNQNNLAEDQPCTDDINLCPLDVSCSAYSMLAISPKKENSETNVSGTSSRGWESGVTLPFEECCGYEAESLLLCKVASSLGVDPAAVCSNIGSEDGAVTDQDDNMSCGNLRIESSEAEGDMHKSNLSNWKSIEEISEAGGGEDGSSHFPEDEDNNLQDQEEDPLKHHKEADAWNDPEGDSSLFASRGSPKCLQFNILSEDDNKDGKHQTPVMEQDYANIPEESVSNISIGEETSQHNAAAASSEVLHSEGATQELNKPQPVSPVTHRGSSAQPGTKTCVPETTHKSDSAPLAKEKNPPTVDKAISKDDIGTDDNVSTMEHEAALYLLGGSFGTFKPRKKINTSRQEINSPPLARKNSVVTCKGQESLSEAVEVTGRELCADVNTEEQREDNVSLVFNRQIDKPKTIAAFKGKEFTKTKGDSHISGEGETEEEKELKISPKETVMESLTKKGHGQEDTLDAKKPMLPEAEREEKGKDDALTCPGKQEHLKDATEDFVDVEPKQPDALVTSHIPITKNETLDKTNNFASEVSSEKVTSGKSVCDVMSFEKSHISVTELSSSIAPEQCASVKHQEKPYFSTTSPVTSEQSPNMQNLKKPHACISSSVASEQSANMLNQDKISVQSPSPSSACEVEGQVEQAALVEEEALDNSTLQRGHPAGNARDINANHVESSPQQGRPSLQGSSVRQPGVELTLPVQESQAEVVAPAPTPSPKPHTKSGPMTCSTEVPTSHVPLQETVPTTTQPASAPIQDTKHREDRQSWPATKQHSQDKLREEEAESWSTPQGLPPQPSEVLGSKGARQRGSSHTESSSSSKRELPSFPLPAVSATPHAAVCLKPYSPERQQECLSQCPISYTHKATVEVDMSFKNKAGSCNESESDGSVPELEEPESPLLRASDTQSQLSHSAPLGDESMNKAKQSRSEKKARKVRPSQASTELLSRRQT